MLRFTEDHEWLKLDGDVATVGITSYAAEQLGDLVYIELPKVGAVLAAGAPAVLVESVKAASDVFAPLAGEVVDVNAAAAADPTVVGHDPQRTGWLYKMRLADAQAAGRLMDTAAYEAFTS